MENKYAHSDFDSFYLEYSPKLWRLAYRLTRNRYDSEDLVDEAFLIYLQKSTTMVIDNPEAYITRILANLVRNYARLSWHNEFTSPLTEEQLTKLHCFLTVCYEETHIDPIKYRNILITYAKNSSV